MNISAKEYLTKARHKLEGGWTRDAAARDAAGTPVSPRAPYAVSFCLSGSLVAACDALDGCTCYFVRPLTTALEMALIRRGCHLNLASFNDSVAKSKEDVLALIDDVLADEIILEEVDMVVARYKK